MVPLTVRLSDGESVTLTASGVDELYEQLWQTPRRGAILAALKLADVRRRRDPARLIKLNEHESAAFRDALARCPRAVE